ncbi:nitroreductase [Olsenella profusa DSM 13989]|uniref:nitroreductase family protein n=1 Tax=Olsenella profusa TaxID=138595 RepID=UPI002781BF70|nr:nitroreductase family protein [Olsenella profusa]MDP9859434.1 nitroreductase [Olsenella profusa DSM 13989]
MSLMDTFLARRSVRQFTGEPVSDDEIRQIVEAGMLAPTGKGIRPWHFITIQDPDHIHGLIGCRRGGPAMLETATAAIAVLGDTTKSDTCIEDSSVALENMHLMAFSLGLGSCWLQVRLRPSEKEGVSTMAFLRERLGFPNQMELEALLVLGHSAKEPASHALDELPRGRIHREVW